MLQASGDRAREARQRAQGLCPLHAASAKVMLPPCLSCPCAFPTARVYARPARGLACTALPHDIPFCLRNFYRSVTVTVAL